MHNVTAAKTEDGERCTELLALLNMITYAQAIATDLDLGGAAFHLDGAAHELSHAVAQLLQIDLEKADAALLASGKIGRC